MSISEIQAEWEVFASDGDAGIGAVRAVTRTHLDVYLEGYGDILLTPDQIAGAHDGKVLLDLDRLPESVRSAIRHAHDRETR